MNKQLIAAIALFSVATTSWAESFPYLAIVTDIAPNDHLNVRSNPNRLSVNIGSLASNTQVEILGIDESNQWAQIIWNKGNGWVSLRYLQTIKRQYNADGLPLGLSCNGTEPFWDLSIDTNQTNQTIKFNLIDQEQIKDKIIWASQSQNIATQAYAFKGQSYHAILRRTNCSDGMSDRDYGWVIDVILSTDKKNYSTQFLSGCCITVTY